MAHVQLDKQVFSGTLVIMESDTLGDIHAMLNRLADENLGFFNAHIDAIRENTRGRVCISFTDDDGSA